MKKKVVALMLAVVMGLSLVACGGSKEEAPAAEATKEEAPAEEKEEAEEAEEEEEEVVEEEATEEVAEESSEGFSILDLTADLVDTAIYSVDGDNTEYVITLFKDPEGTSYISMMIVGADQSGDIMCGAYDASCIDQFTDDDNVAWTKFEVTDVYTGNPFTVIFTEGDDGSVAVTNADFSLIMEGQYLSQDDAITYMGVAANYIN